MRCNKGKGKYINNRGKVFLLFSLFILIVLTVGVVAESHLPLNLQKINDYNKKSTIEFSVQISFFIAFLAGILAILSPCILPLVPAYFSYTFKEKKNITMMTFVFFLGFSSAFIAMGIIAGFIGAQVLSVVQKGWLISIAGIVIVGLGIMTLMGKGFSSFIRIKHKTRNDAPGTFLLGVFFAIGWTACLGPILAGILGIGAVLGNVLYSGLLLFFYSLGNLVPLFILSIFYDKFNLSDSKFIKGKMFDFAVAGKKFSVHSTNLISGLLFILVGSVMFIFQGTGIVNTWDIFGTKQYFYSVQNALMQWEYASLFGVLIFMFFLLFIGRVVWTSWKRKS
ncbi:cytochrome c biogenesis protein CcdA [Candidatus Woesearchaeota archaeon]|nr:cytochrome c biogenesis protein CcdA [Candidatus Woesearchaeota archaeon]